MLFSWPGTEDSSEQLQERWVLGSELAWAFARAKHRHVGLMHGPAVPLPPLFRIDCSRGLLPTEFLVWVQRLGG